MTRQIVNVAYLIVGAGPAGVQLGYFMEKAGLDYLIVEAGPGPGTFFERYPRHRKLISINKVHTGYDEAEKNLRWDWNSLLSDSTDMRFKHYSGRYFPSAEDLLRYLRDYVSRHALKVHYYTHIAHVTRSGHFVATAENGTIYHARQLIVATGVSKPYLPSIEGIELAEPYQEFSTDPSDFTAQSVLIIGKGNSGFETAENLIETAALIHIASPRPITMAWKSKFVGHLRAINNNFLDTYQLKVQNAVLDGDIRKIEQRNDGKYVISIAYSHANGECEQLEYDRVLSCTGFRFDASLFDDSCRPALAINDRFPSMTPAWESVNVLDMYFVGTITQQRDYRKTASGFIHGFRYNARALFRLLCKRYEGKEWPRRAVARCADALTDAILERANSTSGLWQQFGFLCDLIQVDSGGAAVYYYEELPLDYVREGEITCGAHYYTLTLEFGDFKGDPFAIERNPDPAKARESKFLHPVVRRFEDGVQINELHLLEDLHAEWSKPCHREPLRAFLAAQLKSRRVEHVQEAVVDAAMV